METIRRAVMGLVVVLVGFAATGCASTGYLGPRPFEGPLGEVVAGNLAMTCPGDYFVGPPVNRCLRHLANIGPHIAGYPMYVGSRGGRQLSRAEKIVLVGAGSAAVGGILTRDWRGAVVAGAAGAITTAVLTRGNGRNSQPVVVREGQQVRVGADGVPVAVGRPVVTPAPASSLGIGSQSRGLVRRATNRTGMEVAVFRKGADPRTEEPVMVLHRGGSFEVPLSGEGYEVYILVPTDTLGVQDVRKAAVVPNHDLNGWDIVVAGS